jgi:hypothetical protein
MLTSMKIEQYKATAPSKTSFLSVLGFIIVAILLLGIPVVPGIFMYETDFNSLNNPTIGNISGVTRILVSFAAFSLLSSNVD